ncbi:hypothetical protein [Nonomuraea sp. NPDC050783]|uniref:hypothetical protein n=1 Tax=Nonomuraea sp. NPDC050783 TaxID=3154634 RepID=UPI0034657D3F
MITGAADRAPERVWRRTYVYAAGWDGPSPFTATYERLRDDPGWRAVALDGGHTLMRDAPDDLARVLAESAAPTA